MMGMGDAVSMVMGGSHVMVIEEEDTVGGFAHDIDGGRDYQHMG